MYWILKCVYFKSLFGLSYLFIVYIYVTTNVSIYMQLILFSSLPLLYELPNFISEYGYIYIRMYYVSMYWRRFRLHLFKGVRGVSVNSRESTLFPHNSEKNWYYFRKLSTNTYRMVLITSVLEFNVENKIVVHANMHTNTHDN